MATRTVTFQPSRKEFITGIVILSALACISMSRSAGPASVSAATFEDSTVERTAEPVSAESPALIHQSFVQPHE
ncbi:MAG TPA: hypothetical protein VG711_01905 [Phycisphaerales bacterium]|nr:hypothetical protein [Phycisphaerales bacterium]